MGTETEEAPAEEPKGEDPLTGSDRDDGSQAVDTVPSEEDTAADNTEQPDTDGKSENRGSDDDGSLSEHEISAKPSKVIRQVTDKDGNSHYTPEYRYIQTFWKSLAGRAGALHKNSKTQKDTDAPFELTVSGRLPEDVTAEVSYLQFDEGNTFTEKALFAIDLTLLDGKGKVYKPEEPVTVTVTAADIEDAADDGDALLVYAYEENTDREDRNDGRYAADAVIYKDGSVNDKLLAYNSYNKDGADAVSYAEDEDGLDVDEDEGSASFEYGFGQDTDTAHFMLASQAGEQTLKATSGSNVITVEGALRKNVSLEVSEITEKNKAYDDYVGQAADAVGADEENVSFTRAFDIKIIDEDTGREFPPDSDVKVSIGLKDENLSAGDDTSIDVVHFQGSGTEDTEVMDSSVSGKTVEFSTDGFSVYVVVGYTVDFHWGEYTYSIEGESSIWLSSLLNELAKSEKDDAAQLKELAGDMSRIKDVSFSDPKLVKVEKKSSKTSEDDWLLTSLKAFDTEETLTIELTDGSKITVKVTDVPPTSYKYYVERNNGNNGQSFNTLKEAVDSVNGRNYPCYLHIGEDCVLNESVTFDTQNTRAVTIFGNNHTITRGNSVTGDLITFSRSNTDLVINDLTIDGNDVAATGSLLKMSSGTLTMNNVSISGHTAAREGVCAVDASGANNINLKGNLRITGNTGGAGDANLNIGSKTITVPNNETLTGTIGIYSDSLCDLNTEFGSKSNNSVVSGATFKNDVNPTTAWGDVTGYWENNKVTWRDPLYTAENEGDIFRVVSTGRTYTELSDAYRDAGSNDTIEMLKDYILSGTVTLSGKNVKLTTAAEYEGHSDVGTIYRTPRFTSAASMIAVKNGTLTLENAAVDGSNVKVGVNGAVFSVTNAGNLVLDEGAVVRNGYASGGNMGGGIYVNGANNTANKSSLTMKDGCLVEGCTAERTTYSGGGVAIYHGTFIMEGGIVRKCHAGSAGGGIAIGHGNANEIYANISGGLITACTSGAGGAALETHAEGGIYVSSITITGNNGGQKGAVGFYSADSGPIFFSGSPRIYGNTIGGNKESNVAYEGTPTSTHNIQVIGKLGEGALIGVNSADNATYIKSNNRFGQYDTSRLSVVDLDSMAAFYADNNPDLVVISYDGKLVWQAGLRVTAKYYFKGHPDELHDLIGGDRYISIGTRTEPDVETFLDPGDFRDLMEKRYDYLHLLQTELSYKEIRVYEQASSPEYYTNFSHICSYTKRDGSNRYYEYHVRKTDGSHPVINGGRIELIYEVDPEVKLTDGSNNILRTDNGNYAVFDSLADAFESIGSNRVKDRNSGEDPSTPANFLSFDSYTGSDYKVQLLKSSHTMTDGAAKSGNYNVTLTTAGTDHEDFPGPGGTAVITNGGITSASMIKTGMTSLTVDDIKLDGGNVQTSADGALINVSKAGAALILNQGATLTNGNTRGKGGAVYVADEARMNMNGATITANNSTEGGAVNAGGASSIIRFSGNAVVSGNTGGADGKEKRNVVLSNDTAAVIGTAGLGLGSKAKIGVYVEGDMEDPGGLFGHRGVGGAVFGTYGADADGNLKRFTNDRNGLKAEKGDGDREIRWSEYIARVTSDGGEHWYYFAYLINSDNQTDDEGQVIRDDKGNPLKEGAFDYANTLSGDVIIETLLETHDRYTLTSGFTFNKAEMTILTLRTTDDEDWNPDGFRSTLVKNHSGSMITASFNGEIITEDIILDGGSEKGITTTSDGGLVRVTNGAIAVRGGTTMQNVSLSSYNGGAVWTKDNIPVSIIESAQDETILFKNCTAKNGGAVYVTKGNIEITSRNTNDPVRFESCKSTIDGGAIYQNGGTSLTLTNAAFGKETDADSGCQAADEGGAIYTSISGTLTNCTFYHCKTTGISSGGGGAIFYSGGSHRLNGCIFESCEAAGDGKGKGNGGAIKLNEGSALVIGKSDARRSSFSNCMANRYGGAIEYEPEATGELSITDTDFSSCISSTVDGGAVASDARTLNISGCTFDKCKAEKGNGGAIADGLDGSANPTMIIENTSISECSAKSGAAVYIRYGPSAVIKQSGTGACEIKTCTASDTSGGAVNLAASRKVSFEGNVVIYNNISTKSGNLVQANVVLDKNNYTTINTTDTGLGSGAHIGIYVTGNMPPASESDPYKSRGGFEDDFGTHGTSTDNLDAFTNDRNGLYGEACPVSGHGTLIRWTSYLCKVTDSSGNLLYERSGSAEGGYTYRPAVYKFLKTQSGNTGTGGFDAAQGELYTFGGAPVTGSAPVQVQMLKNYTQPSTDQPAVSGSRALTFTTANNNAAANPLPADIYIYYRGTDTAHTEADRATITRGSDEGSMFTSTGDFTTEKNILDGGANITVNTSNRNDWSNTGLSLSVSGGMINASGGALSIHDRTEMRNTVTAVNGGAVYAAASVDLEIQGNYTAASGSTPASYGVKFYRCQARIGGAVYQEKRMDGALDISGAEFNMCRAHSGTDQEGGGGVFTLARNVDLQNSYFEGCFTSFIENNAKMSQGGGLFQKYTETGSSISVSNCRFNDCRSTGAGGALESEVQTMTVSGSVFTDCEARNTGQRDGGAIDFLPYWKWKDKERTTTDTSFTLTDCTFTGCRAFRKGGAARSTAFTNSITGCTFTQCRSTNNIGGGALAIENDANNCTAVINGTAGTTTFSGCYAGNNGGSVYIDMKGELTLKDCRIDGSGRPANVNVNAKNGGGIYVAAGTLNLNIADHDNIINNCLVSENGGAVYLASGSKLNIAGSPDFGGTDYTTGDTLISGSGNYRRVQNYQDSRNGGIKYPKAGNTNYYLVRQDIYIGGYEGANAPSLVVTGAITSGNGTIWIGAEKDPHFKQNGQFALFGGDAVSNNELVLADDVAESTMMSFRNAASDSVSENGTDSWLHGVRGDGLYIKWNGLAGKRQVIIRKVDGSNVPVQNAVFTIYRGSTEIEGIDINGTRTTSFTSGSSGIFYIGQLEYGVYVIHETSSPGGGTPYFYVVVDGKGSASSAQEYSTKAEAQTAGDAALSARSSS